LYYPSNKRNTKNTKYMQRGTLTFNLRIDTISFASNMLVLGDC